ncbi:MAG: D-alanyl-D-alanine carboxypeptidase [bacterium]|nr:D-alanyl-D-alanine carboxypeptidase [bacterium]
MRGGWGWRVVVGGRWVAAWLAWAGSGGRAESPQVVTREEQREPAGLRQLIMRSEPVLFPGVVAGPALFVRLAREWTFADTVYDNRVPVRKIGQVPAGIVVDATSGRVLWAKNARTPMQIASLTKMMTLLLAVEALQRGEIELETPVTVTRTAATIGGSQVYLREGETFALSELLKTIIIASANDAAQLVAERLGGSAEVFVARMNERAGALGMKSARFYNAHGLPMGSGRNVASALDVALLARQLVKYPLVTQWSSTWVDRFRGGTFTLYNHNRLVKTVPGCDGLKTGYYRAAGYSNAVTVQREGVRMIVVVLGVGDRVTRDEVAKELVEWGYRQRAGLAAR